MSIDRLKGYFDWRYTNNFGMQNAKLAVKGVDLTHFFRNGVPIYGIIRRRDRDGFELFRQHLALYMALVTNCNGQIAGKRSNVERKMNFFLHSCGGILRKYRKYFCKTIYCFSFVFF